MLEVSPQLRKLFRQQDGIVGRRQLRDAGLTDKVIQGEVRARRWRHVHPGVIATFTGPLPRKAAIQAAMLYAGDGAALSHHTAAEAHGLTDTVDQTIHITVPVDRRVRSRDGIRIHYAHRLPTTRSDHRSPAVVNVNDTVLDLVDVAATPNEAIDWVTRACQRRRTIPARLRAALARRKKIRWRPMIEAALADVAAGAETPLELAYLRHVERAHGLPTGRRQRHRRTNGRSQWIDVEYSEFTLRVELDGRIGHVGDGAFRDRTRDNSGVVSGYATLRFGWTDVYYAGCATASQVTTVLKRGGWQGAARGCGPACPAAP